MDRSIQKKIQDLEHENQSLKTELETYRNNPAANFYKAVTKAMDDITAKVNNKSLKIKDDEFTESIILLLEKSEKIFKGLKEGISAFQVQENKDKALEKSLGKNQAKAI